MTDEKYKKLIEKILNGDQETIEELEVEAIVPIYKRAQSYFKRGKIQNIKEQELLYRATRVFNNMVIKYISEGTFPETYNKFISYGKEKISRKLYNIHVKRNKKPPKPRKKRVEKGDRNTKKQDIYLMWLEELKGKEDINKEKVDNSKFVYTDEVKEKLKQKMFEFLKSANKKTENVLLRYYGLDRNKESAIKIAKDLNLTRARIYQIINSNTQKFFEYYKNSSD